MLVFLLALLSVETPVTAGSSTALDTWRQPTCQSTRLPA